VRTTQYFSTPHNFIILILNQNFQKCMTKLSLCVINGARNNSPAVTKSTNTNQSKAIQYWWSSQITEDAMRQHDWQAGWLHGVLQQSTVAGGRGTEVSTDRSFAFFSPVLLHKHLHAYTATNLDSHIHTHTGFYQVASKQNTAPRNLLNLATSHNLATPLSYTSFTSQPHKYLKTHTHNA